MHGATKDLADILGDKDVEVLVKYAEANGGNPERAIRPLNCYEIQRQAFEVVKHDMAVEAEGDVGSPNL